MLFQWFKNDCECNELFNYQPLDFILDLLMTAESRTTASAKFVVTGVLDSTVVAVHKPLTGQVLDLYNIKHKILFTIEQFMVPNERYKLSPYGTKWKIYLFDFKTITFKP